ncbi:MAG: hypothetical protein R6W77_14520 [Trueperaceae bacterium]
MRGSRRRAPLVVAIALSLSLLLGSCSFGPGNVFLPGRLQTGLFSLGFTALEGLMLLGTAIDLLDETSRFQFGPLSGRFLAGIATGDGFAVVDLEGLSILHEEASLMRAPMFGVVGLSRTPSGPSSDARIVGFGMGGKVYRPYLGGSGAFDPPVGRGSSAIYDAYPAGGRLDADLTPYVRPSLGIGFMKYDLSAGGYGNSAEVLPAANFSGELVSAYLADDDLVDAKPILVLDRAVNSGLYVDYRDGSMPTRAFDVGLDARKLRCIDTMTAAGHLCAISVFGQDQLGLVNWDSVGLPTWRGFVDVGDGPVGLDIGKLSNGNYGIVSTGFNDDSVTEVEVTATGTLVDTAARDVPTGCVQPGHAIYVPDAEDHNVVGTCYGSGHLFMLKTALQF